MRTFVQRSAYEYQPAVVIEDFDQAADVLSVKVANRVVRAWPHVDASAIEAVCVGFRRLGIDVREIHAHPAVYAEYRREAAYERVHPTYYGSNLPEKSFEHHLACRLLELQPGDVFVDIASENSVLPEIAARVHGARSYAQDIMYPPGIADGRIGGDACDMPVPTGFATKAALTCSLEHFEGDADTRLFRGLSRVLAKGGKVFVVPLYMLPHASVMTDPLLSTAADVPFDRDAVIYCAKGWHNRHGRFYSPETLAERILTPSADAFRFTVFRVRNGHAIDPSIYANFALLAERT